MDKSLSQYDESLQALERQRENLEIVMQKMGEEWEESGAGVGWMRDSFYQTTTTANHIDKSTLKGSPYQPPTSLYNFMPSVTSSSSSSGPSPDYLQTLLNVNDEILAQSLASIASSRDEERDTQDLRSTSTFVTRLPISPPLVEQEEHLTSVSMVAPKQNQSLSTPPFTPDEKQT